jgi:hypothetical protein
VNGWCIEYQRPSSCTEQRKIGDPEKFEGLGIEQVLSLRDRQAELPEQARRALGGSRGHQQQVVGAGVDAPERRPQHALAERLDRTERRLAGPDPDQTGEAHLLGLIDEHVELTPRVLVAAGHGQAANHPAVGNDLLEHPELRIAEDVGQVVNLQPAPQIRLVRSVLRDCLRVGHAANRQRDVAPDLLEDLAHQGLDQAVDDVRSGKGHLDVDLGQLELTVGPLIFVAEAADDLKVTVGPCDHQDLLENLRRLRQRVKLPGVDPARHQEVARARAWTWPGWVSRSPRSRWRRNTFGSPSRRGAASPYSTATACGAGRDSDISDGLLPTPASRRRSGTAASWLR